MIPALGAFAVGTVKAYKVYMELLVCQIGKNLVIKNSCIVGV